MQIGKNCIYIIKHHGGGWLLIVMKESPRMRHMEKRERERERCALRIIHEDVDGGQ